MTGYTESQDFPVVTVEFPNGVMSASDVLTGGYSFRNAYMKSEVEQLDPDAIQGDDPFADKPASGNWLELKPGASQITTRHYPEAKQNVAAIPGASRPTTPDESPKPK